MIEAVLTRLLMAAVPFAVYGLWREQARRTGRPMGSTPWGWLVAAAALIVALSLVGTVLFHEDNRRQTYVPGEAGADGRVSEGHFIKAPPAR